jgi:YidC/Oxa1 family membrane protein insertase
MIGGLFEIIAKPMEGMYALTHSYILMIAVMALIVIVITAPLVLKQTKGMLEMQKLAPLQRKIQSQYRDDRQKMNEELMKLFQEHKVNPLASCLPLVLQFPVFIIMYRMLTGLTSTPSGQNAFEPKYISKSSELYASLKGKTEMLSWGLNLHERPVGALRDSLWPGLAYALLILVMAGLYLFQQKMVASRSQVSPTMSAAQQKLFQYLPVVFALFMFFYLTGLVIFYMAQAVFRIGLNYYITHRFYKGDESLGQQAQRASAEARELAKTDGGVGLFNQAKREVAKKQTQAPSKPVSKRVTPPKNKPTGGDGSPRHAGRPPSSGRANRPPSRHPKKK